MNKLDFEVTAIEKVFFNNSASGTATLIHQNQGYVALITVAHIVSFPDTLYTYFFNPDGSSSQYVQSISIKTNQSNYIPDLPQGGGLEIILMDKNIDIAILGGKFLSSETQRLTIFNYPWGNSSELEWGSFVYIFGFPMNYKMISKGIVSNPGRDKSTFLIDAVFSRGFSGGTVLAVRDGVPNFELVGFVKSVPADFQYTLRPLTKKNELDFNPLIPYKGDIYVDKEQVLRAGITKVIGIETVKDFILDHKQELINKGYYFDNLFGAKDKTTLKIIH